MSLHALGMRTLFLSLTFMAPTLASAQTPAKPVTELVPVTDVFSPTGFDTNDNTQVVVAGYLPDLCYKAPKVSAEMVGNQVKLKVTAMKDCDPNEFCLPVIVPFVEAVDLGVLDKGKYQIRANAGTQHEANSEITVIESSSSAIDDYLYANVQYVEGMTGTRQIYLRGENPSPCFDIDRIEWHDNGNDTYSVLPILKQVSQVCPQQMTPFKYPATVPATLTKDYSLLHIRVMNGKSVNHLWGDLPY